MKSLLRKYSSDKLVVNYLRVFSIDVLVKVSGVLLLPVFLKLMTQEEFGLYGYLLAIVSTFSLVFNFGVYAAQSKLYHDYGTADRSKVMFTLNVVLIVFLVVSLGVVAAAGWDRWAIDILFKFPLDYDRYRLPVLLGLVVNVYALLLTNYFLTSDEIGKLQRFNTTRIIGINGLVIIALWVIPVDDHAWLRLTGAYVIEFLIVIYFSRHYWRAMEMKLDGAVARKAIAICLPIVFSAVLGILINLGDRYFLEKHGSMEQLSVYNVALTFASVVPFVFNSFQSVWLPHFLKEKDLVSNRLRARKMVLRLLIFFIVLAIALVVGVKLTLVTGIIDDKYSGTLDILPFVLASAILSSLTTLYSNHLILLNKLHFVILVGVPVAVISYLLNKNLVPVWGVFGAATASIVANATYLGAYAGIVTWLYGKKERAELPGNGV